MSDKILGYRKTGRDTWEPIRHSKGYIYTAAVMHCGSCGNMISGMGGPGTQNTVCPACYEIKQRASKGWVCPKCGIDRTKDQCPRGHMAAVTGDCPMIATAQVGESHG